MSDKYLQTRKTFMLNTAIFGGSSLALIVSTVLKIIAGGSWVSIFLAIALLLAGVRYYQGSRKAYKDLEYQKSQSKGYMASLSSVAGLILSFII